MSRIAAITIVLGLAFQTVAAGGEMPKAGDPFPAWSLPDHNGNQVSSADLAGSTYVLWFYPKAMTPGCTIEGNAFRDSHAAFASEGVKIFGVSFDPPAENARFAETQGFPYPLLSDQQKTLGKAVGAASSQRDYARRISFLVDGKGIVLEAYESVDPAGHAAQVLRDAAAAR